MCPLRRALTIARRVQRTAADGWASWSGREVECYSPKVTLGEPGSGVGVVVDGRW
jgi:hypothetical protein